MNNWQIAKQIQYELKKRKWGGDASNSAVFISVKVLFVLPDKIIQEVSFPAAHIVVQTATADLQEPGLLMQPYDIKLITRVEGDNVGENALLGTNRTAGTSKGRGLFEVEEELHAVIRKMESDVGIKILSRFQGDNNVEGVSESGYIVSRTYSIVAYITDTRFYHLATRFIATGGSGEVVMTWELPPDRFDRKKMVLRRAVGATAPETETDGTGVTIAALATGVTDTIAAGTYSYSLFAGYSEFGAADPNVYSDPISRVSVIVS